jgi:hypothetical protein
MVESITPNEEADCSTSTPMPKKEIKPVLVKPIRIPNAIRNLEMVGTNPVSQYAVLTMINPINILL